MKTILALVFLTLAQPVFACPAGQHLHGGYGKHHAGGYCSY